MVRRAEAAGMTAPQPLLPIAPVQYECIYTVRYSGGNRRQS